MIQAIFIFVGIITISVRAKKWKDYEINLNMILSYQVSFLVKLSSEPKNEPNSEVLIKIMMTVCLMKLMPYAEC